ncbi:sensor histidine kinase [Dongia rigui]|uniref:histidine kinase n=1 Tax=Dongia rigui TaxID=940149 RepID=A0ABU5DTE9_9PROT|nr:ATP-binding protein [Dongia rigui]MDY0870595.1 ATP-binding protein [Dongia rigui]
MRVLSAIAGLTLIANLFFTWHAWRRRARGPAYAEAFMSLVLDSVDAAITVYDAKGRLLRANKGAEQLSGFSEAELLDPATWRHILPEMDYDRVVEIVSGRRADEYPVINENYWVHRSGEKRLLRWSNVALKDAKGRISLIVCIGFDITEQRRFEGDLITAKNDAEIANRAKSEFLANMSHELRTPLNAILGFAEVIRDQRLATDLEVMRRYATDIYDSGHLLLQLINDILDMAKLESGRIDLEERELDVPAIIASSRRLVEQKAVAGGVELQTEIAPGLPPLMGGERALKQIVLNLLSNAVKFTPQNGTTRITAGLNKQGGMEIAVSDSGIGIAAASLEKLFQPFYQVDAKVSRRYGGTGLGLAITKKLVDAHNGQIAVSSSPNQGTKVTVTFPPSRTLHALRATRESQPEPGSLAF